MNTLEKYSADAVFGRIISNFTVEAPKWIQKCYIFNRTTSKTGTAAKSAVTGNCIIKSSVLKNIEGPFDPKYGLTGGEDTKLFSILHKKNAKFISCYEAIVIENIPGERTKLPWLFKRAFRTGNIYSRVEIDLEKKNRMMLRIKHGLIAGIFIVISVIFIVFTCFDKYNALNWSLKASSNLGKISAVLGFFPKGYN